MIIMTIPQRQLEEWKKTLASSGVRYNTDEEYEEALHG